VQEEVAPALLTMLQGAMAQLQLGNPAALATDIGPIIDPTALQRLGAHVAAMQQRGLRVVPLGQLSAPDQQHGLFIQPTLITLNQLDDLQGEVFGPILHVITFKQGGLLPLIDQINATGYGLTFGLHTRLDSVIEAVVARAKAGNIYVNRNMVGAVVGVQPFGGEGLSGTGPKAGGPLYLSRLLAEAPADMLTVAATFAGDSQQLTPRHLANAEALQVMQIWAAANGYPAVAARAIAYQKAPPLLFDSLLTGPTGEENRYQLLPRQSVLSLAVREEDRLMQLAALLNLGCSVLWPIEAKPLLQRLPALVQAAITLVTDWQHAEVELGAVVLHGDAAARLSTAQALAKRDGAIIPLITLDQESSGLPLERLVIERAISTNTAAAGGNASLMVLG
jgi:RHH-type proline utilization regulon transcriptional repressor/proline dehydrogenase/delta 1-pyrroline-5-carboxylate dehydrogenase